MTNTNPRNYAELVERVREDERQSSRQTLVLDLEADNLLPLATTIWCVCTKLLETGEERTFYDKDSFTEYISEVEPTHVVMHNGLGFDLECLCRVWGIPYTVGREPTFEDKSVVWVDTLLLSRFLNADRIGGHSLEAWGERLGFPKGSHSDWSQLSDEMVKYCQQDVRVTERVLHSLQQEVEEYDGPIRRTPPPPAKVCHRKPTGYQGETEAYVDPHRLGECTK